MTPPMGFGRSGKQTPTFSGSRPGTPDLVNIEEGFTADTEDLDYDSGRKKPKARKSWLHFGGDSSGKGTASGGSKLRTHGTGGLSESMPMSPMTAVPGDFGRDDQNGMGSGSAGPSRNTSQDFDNVARGNGGKRGSPARGGGGAQMHTYPPSATPDRRLSTDAQSVEDGQVLAQAAKVLKAVVLHDARNIKGKDTTDADVSFTITSPHEAKVCNYYHIYLSC